MTRTAKSWASVLVCLVLLQTIGSLVLRGHGFPLTALSDIVQLALLLCAALSYVPNILKSSGRTRLFWSLMATGLFSWMSYQFFWTFIEVVQRREVPNLFVGDIVLFLHIVPMMAALGLQPNVSHDERELRLGSLDFAFLFVWWIYLYVFSIIPWQYVHADDTAYGHNLNLAYMVEKVAFLIALAALWARSSGLWRTMYAHWFGASALYSLSSYIANWALNHNWYYSGSLYDVPLTVSMAWMAVPSILALKNPAAQEASAKALPRSLWTARLGMLAVFSLPIFAWLSFFDGSVPASVRSFRLVLTLAAMMVMGALIFLKQHFLDIELIRLLRSSRQSFLDLQLLQAQLVQSEKLASMGQLVGGAAHELNNPLTAMLGYSELLGTTELTVEQRALSEKISHQAKRIRTLVSSLLSFAKQVPSSKTSLDINMVLQTAVKLCQPQMQAANVQYSLFLSENLPRVHGDSNQLLKVFSHILSNSVNAIGDRRNGQITLSTGANDGIVTTQFSDSGPGIAEPARVFDPFYTTRPVGEGTGLGLSMCYGIIQEHGGKISCRNREEGGACFTIELPAAQAERLQAQAHAANL